MHSVKLDSFPSGNPFHHDLMNVGAELPTILGSDEKFKGCYIMGAAFQKEYDFYIVNSNTGERLGVKL